MNRWILFVLIIGSTIAIAYPVYHYQHAINQPLIGNYLFAGLIIEGFVLFLIQNHIENKRRIIDRKDIHKQSFYDMLDVFASPPRIVWDQASTYKFQWCDHGGYDLFSHLMSHLEKYDLGKLYKENRKYYDDKISEIEVKIKEFGDYVDKKLEPFTDLPEQDRFIGISEPHIVRNQIKKGLFTMISANVFNHIPITSPTSSNQKPYSALYVSGNSCGAGDESTIKKLMEIISSLTMDEKLVSMIKELDKMEKQIDESYCNKFNTERKSLLLKLREGQQDLKGKCELCPK